MEKNLSSKVKVSLIKANEVKHHWHLIEDKIKSVADMYFSDFTLEDIYNSCCEGKTHLWIVWGKWAVIDAAIVTAVYDAGGKRWGTYLVVSGGNLREWWKPVKNIIDDFFQSVGVQFLQGTAPRKAWLRLFDADRIEYAYFKRL